MKEYLIRRTNGEWFDLPPSSWPDLMPTSIPWKHVTGWGDYRIEINGVETSFSYEDPGIQISFEGELPETVADRVVEEVLANIEKSTGQRGRIIPL
jgi:hypothetical protein